MKRLNITSVLALIGLVSFAACEKRTTIIREEHLVSPVIKEQPDVNLEIKGTSSGVSVEVDHKP